MLKDPKWVGLNWAQVSWHTHRYESQAPHFPIMLLFLILTDLYILLGIRLQSCMQFCNNFYLWRFPLIRWVKLSLEYWPIYPFRSSPFLWRTNLFPPSMQLIQRFGKFSMIIANTCNQTNSILAWRYNTRVPAGKLQLITKVVAKCIFYSHIKDSIAFYSIFSSFLKKIIATF